MSKDDLVFFSFVIRQSSIVNRNQGITITGRVAKTSALSLSKRIATPLTGAGARTSNVPWNSPNPLGKSSVKNLARCPRGGKFKLVDAAISPAEFRSLSVTVTATALGLQTATPDWANPRLST